MWRKLQPWGRVARVVAVASLLLTSMNVSGPVALAERDGDPGHSERQDPPADPAHQPPTSACRLGNGRGDQRGDGHGEGHGDTQHVIFIEFDNTHFTRDRRNVPSDLEQMPHLLSFIRDNGTLLTNDHTILISHTAGGFLSTFTGLNPDHTGQAVSNSYRYFTGTGTTGTASASSFKYWTDLVDDTGTPPADASFNMVTDGGKNTPAPWVSYTRAGCDFGAVGAANIVLENTGTGPHGDITSAFGSSSPEAIEVMQELASTDPKVKARPQADFVGLAIHCGTGGICTRQANAANARPDVLPDEPDGYTGFKALFGGKYVDPAITGQPATTPVKDMQGNPITDPTGNPGFPGFDNLSAAVSLGYVAQMQEAGVPVTYAYISDAHDDHHNAEGRNVAFGPGEAGYKQQLQAYDQAFAAFFERLAQHGITRQNTLFVFTVDEGDHFVGGNSPDGTWSHTFCNVSIPNPSCPPNQIGEVTANIAGLLPPDPARPVFTIHADSAPVFWVKGQPGRSDPAVRKLERDIAAAQAVDPYISPMPAPIMTQMVDTVGERLLHMVTADPLRTPTFSMFANPDYFIVTSNTNCPDTAHSVPVCVDYHFAWSHGDVQADIANTWLGMVGPGVDRGGVDSRTWSDHTDVRPTMMALLGLKDDYRHDGRVLFELLDGGRFGDDDRSDHGDQPGRGGHADQTVQPGPTSQASATEQFGQDRPGHGPTVQRLAEVYKQINAPFGQLGHDVLVISTAAIKSNAPGDARYAELETKLEGFNTRRDAIAGQMIALLDGVEFNGQSLDQQQARSLIDQAESLLRDVHTLAASV
jgi:hypothetical protein